MVEVRKWDMEAFTERAVKIIKEIPEGKVMTYGQIARLAGSPLGARQVVRILHAMSKTYHLPWHRVINAKGEISFTDDESYTTQRMSLEIEGVQFTDENTINLDVYQHHPEYIP